MSYATFAGFPAYDQGGASFHLEPGPEPSRGTISMLAKDSRQLNKFGGHGDSMIFYDHKGQQTEIKHLFVESISDAEPGLVTVSLVDSRSLWKYRTGTWILNLTYDDGETYNTQTTNGSTPWTFDEIIRKFGTALTNSPGGGFKPTIHYSSALKNLNIVLQNVHFECMSAAEAMQNCLAIAGGFISIDFNGDIWVIMPGDKAPSIDENDEYVTRMAVGDKANLLLNKPRILKLKYRILREKKFTNDYWEPVMEYPPRGKDGKLFDGASHGRPGEWGTAKDVLEQLGYTVDQIKTHYFNLPAFIGVEEDKNKASIVNYIQSQFYKYFRFKAPLTTSTEDREQILPFHATLATYSRADSDEKHNCPAYADQTYGLWAPEQNGVRAIARHYVDPFCVSIVDQNQGVIKFDTGLPVCYAGDVVQNDGMEKTDFTLGKLDISVYMAYIKKFNSSAGLQDDYYIPSPSGAAASSGYEDKWSGSGNNNETMEMLVEDVYCVEQEASGTWTAINSSTIDSNSAGIAEDFFSGYKSSGVPREITRCSFDNKINRLYHDMQYTSIIVDTVSGGVQVIKYDDANPINPFSKNYLDSYGDMQGVGNSYRLGSKKKISRKLLRSPSSVWSMATPEDIKFTGLMSHCADYGKRGADRVSRRPSTVINEWTTGLLVAEDFADGDSGVNHRTKTCRVHDYQDFRPHYSKVAKTDDCYHHGRKMWETRLVAEENKRGAWGAVNSAPNGPSALHNPSLQGNIVNATGVVQTPGWTAPYNSGGGSGGKADVSGGGLTSSTPAPISTAAVPKAPGTTDATGRGISTYVWDISFERGPSNKGPLNNVLQVGRHRKTGTDPDGNNLCRLEIDHEECYLHTDDELCGPEAHIGKTKKPPPQGVMVAVDKIFRDDIKKWDWVAYMSGGGIPPGTPTPGPGGTPTPPPGVPVPGPGEPPPQPGGPVITPEPGPGEPSVPPAAGSPSPPGRTGGGAVTTTGGRVPWGVIINDPNAPPQPRIPELPPGSSYEPPGEVYDPWLIHTEDCHAYNPEREAEAKRKIKLADYTGGRLIGGAHEILSAQSTRRVLPWFDTPANIHQYEWTPGGSYKADPYVPGSQVHPTCVRPYERPSPYTPGSGILLWADEHRFDLAGQPTTFTYTTAAFDSERITDKVWKATPNIGDALVKVIDNLNATSGRVEDIYNNKAVLKAGGDTGSFNATDPFTGAPITVTVVNGQITAGLL